MKRTIRGELCDVICDTDISTVLAVCKYGGDDGDFELTLYQTRDGEFFLYEMATHSEESVTITFTLVSRDGAKAFMSYAKIIVNNPFEDDIEAVDSVRAPWPVRSRGRPVPALKPLRALRPMSTHAGGKILWRDIFTRQWVQIIILYVPIILFLGTIWLLSTVVPKEWDTISFVGFVLLLFVLYLWHQMMRNR